MLVISSPSGAGKTTLSRRLLEVEPGLAMSVSMTTRKPRPGERNGIDYHFVDEPAFRAAVAEEALLEWAEVFGNLYGTPRGWVDTRLAAGRDVLFDVDWQGARQIDTKAGGDVVSVFILPPSARALEERLVKRAQDDAEVVRRRMAAAAREIGHYDEYDYVIVNRDIDESLVALRAILVAERQRRERQTSLGRLVEGLLSDLAGRSDGNSGPA
ncbi:MAG: guanylate kinase [Hyphomicrobiaceae bacterium]